MTPLMAAINRTCANVETGFNLINSMPIISAPGGLVRAQLGKVQMLAGATLAGSAALAYIPLSLLGVPERSLQGLRNVVHFGADHMVHGALNTARGYGEFALGFTTLGVANLLFLFPMNASNDFRPVRPYPVENSFVYRMPFYQRPQTFVVTIRV